MTQHNNECEIANRVGSALRLTQPTRTSPPSSTPSASLAPP